MSYDKRHALPANHNLIITDENTGNAFSLTIEKEIGRGGSCIVYKGCQKDRIGNEPVTRSVIVKEFFPKALDEEITRSDTMDLAIPDGVQDRFTERLDLFCSGQAKHIIYANENEGRSLPPVSFSGTAHKTFYTISNQGQGTTLSDLDRTNLTLIDAFKITASICDAIHAVHTDGMKLYLDCKPDNIYVFDNNAYLFDFDTVQSKGRLRYCSFSEGWSAPEQAFDGDTGYVNSPKIGFQTDVFSIGAVLFYLLTGRNPSSDELNQIKTGFDWNSSISLAQSENILDDETFKNELTRIMQAMLEPEADIRKISFGNRDAAVKAKNELLHLSDLAENAPYRKGFEDTNVNIDNARDSIEKTIRKHSIKAFFFGSKKRVLATLSAFVVIAIAFGIISSLGGKMTEKLISESVKIESNMDSHVLLKLSNANHQYEVGLENWRRLDYNRADRDIRTARDEISGQKSQSELDVARINNSLGCLYLDMGKYKEAYDYLNSAYVTFRDELGAASVEARAVRASIAQYYYNTGMQEEALTETQYILDNSDAKSEQAIIASTSHLRAMVFDAQGKYDQALELYQQVLEMYSSISVDGKMSEQLANYANDPKLSQSEKDYYTNAIRWIVLTYNNIAMVNNHKGDAESAIAAVNTGLDLSLSNIYLGKRNLTTSKLYMNLAIAQAVKGNYKDAIGNIDLAMRIQRNLFDFEDVFPGLVRVYDVYGDILMAQRKDSSAKTYYEDAVELAQNSFGENHPDTAAAYDALGNYCFAMDDMETALDYLTKSIEIRKNILAENHPETAKIYYDLAMVQRATGDEVTAKENLMRAKEICDSWEIEGSLIDWINAALN